MPKSGAIYLLGIWVQYSQFLWEIGVKVSLKGCILSLPWDIPMYLQLHFDIL